MAMLNNQRVVNSNNHSLSLGFTIIHYVNNDVIVKHHVVIMFCQIKWSSRYRLVHDLCDSFLWQKHRPLATARATKSAISPVHWFPVSYGHTTRKISTCCACLSNVNDKSYKQSAFEWIWHFLVDWPLLAEVLHWHLSVVCTEVSRWGSLGNLHPRSLGFQIFPIFISDFDWNKQISSDKHWDFKYFKYVNQNH